MSLKTDKRVPSNCLPSLSNPIWFLCYLFLEIYGFLQNGNLLGRTTLLVRLLEILESKYKTCLTVCAVRVKQTGALALVPTEFSINQLQGAHKTQGLVYFKRQDNERKLHVLLYHSRATWNPRQRKLAFGAGNIPCVRFSLICWKWMTHLVFICFLIARPTPSWKCFRHQLNASTGCLDVFRQMEQFCIEEFETYTRWQRAEVKNIFKAARQEQKWGWGACTDGCVWDNKRFSIWWWFSARMLPKPKYLPWYCWRRFGMTFQQGSWFTTNARVQCRDLSTVICFYC